MMLLSQIDNNRTVSVRVDETVQIKLPENATTGYRWAIERYDAEFIKALPSEPDYASKSVGSAGEIAFKFRARKAGTGELVLKHWRHWEGDSSITDRFRIQFNVRP